MQRETIYRERANGRWEYWLYSDGQRIYISEQLAHKEMDRGALLIRVV